MGTASPSCKGAAWPCSPCPACTQAKSHPRAEHPKHMCACRHTRANHAPALCMCLHLFHGAQVTHFSMVQATHIFHGAQATHPFHGAQATHLFHGAQATHFSMVQATQIFHGASDAHGFLSRPRWVQLAHNLTATTRSEVSVQPLLQPGQEGPAHDGTNACNIPDACTYHPREGSM